MYILILALLCYQPSSALQKVRMQFLPVVNGQSLHFESSNYSYRASADSLNIETFRCYLSKISLYQNRRKVWSEGDSAHLLDAAAENSMLLEIDVPANLKFDELRFTLGIDSAMNAKGIGSGDLDPSKGMYWAWQSGYINLKLEGTSPLCNTRKHAFQYHLGGFLNGFACAAEISLPATKEMKILIDLSLLLSVVELTTEPNVMVPGKRAVELSEVAGKMFSIAP